jgi:hypothetical protein
MASFRMPLDRPVSSSVRGSRRRREGMGLDILAVLADSKEATSFLPGPIRFGHPNRLHGVRTETKRF